MNQNKKSNILGLITARGGSKRVPRKNIREFLGKPLLAWSIETGKASGVFDRFILTTEDEEIAAVGRAYGIDVPFMRPKEYATDTSGSLEPVRHAYEWLRDNEGFDADYIILLEPPSPGRQPFHIKEVADIVQTKNIDSLMGISKLSNNFHPLKVVKKGIDNTIVRYQGDRTIRDSNIRTQDYPDAYYTNSTIYAFKPKNFYESPPSLWGNKMYGYLMDEQYAIDIDTPEDWDLAEMKMKLLLDGK